MPSTASPCNVIPNNLNKTALVTGAGVRLGRATAVELARAGYDLLVHYNSSSEPARETLRLVEQLGRKARLVAADLSNADGVARLLAQVQENTQRLDVLVNNAAIFYPSPTPDDWLDHWDHFHWVNLKSPLMLTVGLLPLLRQPRGCVVNIVDIWSRYPLKRHLPYCVAKSGLEALTRSLALELAPEIRVNGVSPGAALPASSSQASTDKMLSQVPLGTLGGAEAIAQAVEYLCRADYVTGQILAVDGGRTINL